MSERPPLCASAVDALRRPVEITLEDLLGEYQWNDGDVLGALAKLQSTFDAWGMECDPPIGQSDLREVRVLRVPQSNDLSAISKDDIEQGERSDCEFKESLIFDSDKHYKGGKPVADCRSEDVVHSVLKTIAGFLNSDGGRVYVGVRDDGSIAGLDHDYILASRKNPNFDQWELYLRNRIESGFINGRGILRFITVSKVSIDGQDFCRIVVGKKSGLSFVTHEGKVGLYIRSGNQTLSVSYQDIEQFFHLARRT